MTEKNQAPEGAELTDDQICLIVRGNPRVAREPETVWLRRIIRAALAAQLAPDGWPMVPLASIRPIAVEAIRSLNGCSDIEGADGRTLVDELESVAEAAALAAQPTRSQRLADAGYTRRPSWKSLPGAIDGDEAAPSPAEGAAALPSDDDIEWPDIDDMAHSAAQEIYAFGVSHDAIKRQLHGVMVKTASAFRAAIIAAHEATNTQPKGMNDQTAWLLETGGGSHALYWDGGLWISESPRISGVMQFGLNTTKDAGKAVRFVSRELAEAALKSFRADYRVAIGGAGVWKAAEHMWPAVQAPAVMDGPEGAKVRQLAAHLHELRDLLNRRPAMNAGLIEAYAKWTGEVYALDWLNSLDAITSLPPVQGSQP